MAKVIADHKALSKSFNKVKNELEEAENSLTTLFGRQESRFPDSSARFIESHAISSCRFPFPQELINFKRSRDFPDSAEENTSENELPQKKIALRSAVVRGKIGCSRNRRDLILKQNCDTKMRSRNRRIFGMVQSTLQKFQDEAVKRQPQDLKRIKVEQKLEAAEEEKKQLKERAKMELYSKLKEKQEELDCLTEMMDVTELFEVWENNSKYLLNYIVTNAEPSICFLPSSHVPSTKERLESSRIKIQEAIQEKKEYIQNELAQILQSHNLTMPITEVATTLLNDDRENSLHEATQSAFTEENTCAKKNSYLCLYEDELLFD